MRMTDRTRRRASLGVCLAIGALITPAAASADITGAVYRDYDASGARAAREPGIGAVVVQAINNAGAVVATTATATDGTYTLVTPAGNCKNQQSHKHSSRCRPLLWRHDFSPEKQTSHCVGKL